MKKIVFVILIFGSFLLFSCGKKTVIEGIIDNADSCSLVLENFNAGKPIQLKNKVLDKEGKFRFNVPALDTTEIYSLVLDSNKIIRLVVHPEEKILLKTTKDNFGYEYSVEGSEESKLFQEAQSKLWETHKQLEALKKQYSQAATEEEKQLVSDKYEQLFTEHYEYLRHFVYENSNSLVSYLALYQKINANEYVLGGWSDDRYVRLVAQKMSEKHPKSPYLPLVMKELEQRNIQKRNAKVADMVARAKSSYPELTLENPKGESVALSKLNAKYALLYFGILNDDTKEELLAVYNRYHRRGLEIYFVDENPNKEVWKRAVEDLNTPWVNVHDTHKIAAGVYNIQKLPANYIIEIKGTMEGKDLFGSYLREKLDKLLR